MNPITIAEGLQVLAQLIALIQSTQEAGGGTVSGEEWAAAIAPRDAAQKKLDVDIAAVDPPK